MSVNMIKLFPSNVGETPLSIAKARPGCKRAAAVTECAEAGMTDAFIENLALRIPLGGSEASRFIQKNGAEAFVPSGNARVDAANERAAADEALKAARQKRLEQLEAAAKSVPRSAILGG